MKWVDAKDWYNNALKYPKRTATILAFALFVTFIFAVVSGIGKNIGSSLTNMNRPPTTFECEELLTRTKSEKKWEVCQNIVDGMESQRLFYWLWHYYS